MWRNPMGCIVILALSLLARPLATAAQQPENIARIGYLDGRSAAEVPHLLDAFRQGLREFGYVEGQSKRLAALAAELVRSEVAAIVTAGLVATWCWPDLSPAWRVRGATLLG
jgi:putative ABC transport system substrate-binding protein